MDDKILKHLKVLVNKDDFTSIEDNMRFREDLGLDSLKSILFLNNLCEELGISIIELDASKMADITTISDLKEYLTQLA